MSAISTFTSRPFQAFLLVTVTVTLGGCVGYITVDKPADNDLVTRPQATTVVVTGKSYSKLSVSMDGRATGHQDVTGQFVSMGPNMATADLNLPADVYTITASGELPCWYCTGGRRYSNDSNTFIVMAPPPSCTRSASTPVASVPPSGIVVGQTPGRHEIMTTLNGTDKILIIINDAPSLTRTQMRVELDINSDNMKWNKAIEAWGACHSGTRVNMVEASMIGGVNVGAICSPVTAVNDYRSGCTVTQTMLLNQSTTSELLFRKPTFAGVWGDTQVFDSSIWAAWGGRSVRFIWWTD